VAEDRGTGLPVAEGRPAAARRVAASPAAEGRRLLAPGPARRAPRTSVLKR
jgi:hypothetical protein